MTQRGFRWRSGRGLLRRSGERWVVGRRLDSGHSIQDVTR